LCVTNDILQERGYPEVVERFLTEVLTAQQHVVNAYILQQMVAKVDDVITSANTLVVKGALHSVTDELSLLIEWYRDLYRMSDDATLEVVAPAWLSAMLGADGRHRAFGNGPSTRAEISAALREVGAVVQWVRDWQPIAVGAGGPPLVYTPPKIWPATVDLMIYPAGSYLVGRDQIINLNGIYDSTLLKTNKYTALFAEEMITVVKRCHRTIKVTMSLCVNGAMGPLVDICP
jgi:hypothetical protein